MRQVNPEECDGERGVPELPEVETARRIVERELVGREIASV
ncbi:MAG: hypothetical protein C4345_04970, partial [Chloroflexota bacterium]